MFSPLRNLLLLRTKSFVKDIIEVGFYSECKECGTKGSREQSEAAHPVNWRGRNMSEPESRGAQQRKPDLLLAVKFCLTLGLLSVRLLELPR